MSLYGMTGDMMSYYSCLTISKNLGFSKDLLFFVIAVNTM